jgi:hypothetical protein
LIAIAVEKNSSGKQFGSLVYKPGLKPWFKALV